MNEGVAVPQAQLDRWRAYAEQTRADLLAVRHLVAGGQKEGRASFFRRSSFFRRCWKTR